MTCIFSSRVNTYYLKNQLNVFLKYLIFLYLHIFETSNFFFVEHYRNTMKDNSLIEHCKEHLDPVRHMKVLPLNIKFNFLIRFILIDNSNSPNRMHKLRLLQHLRDMTHNMDLEGKRVEYID